MRIRLYDSDIQPFEFQIRLQLNRVLLVDSCGSKKTLPSMIFDEIVLLPCVNIDKIINISDKLQSLKARKLMGQELCIVERGGIDQKQGITFDIQDLQEDLDQVFGKVGESQNDWQPAIIDTNIRQIFATFSSTTKHGLKTLLASNAKSLEFCFKKIVVYSSRHDDNTFEFIYTPDANQYPEITIQELMATYTSKAIPALFFEPCTLDRRDSEPKNRDDEITTGGAYEHKGHIEEREGYPKIIVNKCQLS